MRGKSQKQDDVEVRDDEMDYDGWKMIEKKKKKKETDSEKKNKT
jgi:hypothetical protein